MKNTATETFVQLKYYPVTLSKLYSIPESVKEKMVSNHWHAHLPRLTTINQLYIQCMLFNKPTNEEFWKELKSLLIEYYEQQ